MQRCRQVPRAPVQRWHLLVREEKREENGRDRKLNAGSRHLQSDSAELGQAAPSSDRIGQAAAPTPTHGRRNVPSPIKSN